MGGYQDIHRIEVSQWALLQVLHTTLQHTKSSKIYDQGTGRDMGIYSAEIARANKGCSEHAHVEKSSEGTISIWSNSHLVGSLSPTQLLIADKSGWEGYPQPKCCLQWSLVAHLNPSGGINVLWDKVDAMVRCLGIPILSTIECQQ